MTKEELQQKWVPDSEIPTLLGVSKRVWQGIRKRGGIPFSHQGSIKLVDIADLNEWLEKNKTVNNNK